MQPGTIHGHADKFVAFMKEELIPFINEKYRTTGDNTLFGHSHGGTCTMFTFLTEPDLFKSYIASDPSFWWDNNYLSKLAAERLPEMKDVEASLHISGRAGQGYAGMGINLMDSVLEKFKPEGLLWASDAYKNEIHNSVKYKGIYDGLKWTYSGYSTEPVEFHPMSGMVLKDKPTKIFMMDDVAGIYFTTDGNEPTMESSPMQQLNMITGPATLTARRLGFRTGKVPASKGTFIASDLVKAEKKLGSIKKPKPTFEVFDKSQSKKSIDKGILNGDFNLVKELSDSNKVVILEGYFMAEKEGAYIFAAEREGVKIKCELGDHTLIDVNKESGIISYTIPLGAGFHKLKLTLSEVSTDGFNLQGFFVNPDEMEPRPLEFMDLY